MFAETFVPKPLLLETLPASKLSSLGKLDDDRWRQSLPEIRQ